jgi:ABC transport system ATP-binding/permease protein
MSLVVLEGLTIGYRGPPLLDAVDCRIEARQRIGLLGRNGAGKTTLMRLIVGDEQPDAGAVIIEPNTKISLLQQIVPRDTTGLVGEIIATGVTDESLEEWECDYQVDQIAARMNLDLDQSFEDMSSGMKRRVLLARAIVSNPDLLLLDEPTNHLDIDAINWLEQFLSAWEGAILFVTHDRTFLKNLATRIVEIDRGNIFDWSCDYETFLERKAALLAAGDKQNALFDKKLKEEEVWIRQGIKARRTRNEGRVRALKKMREERSERRQKTGSSRIEIQEGQRSGNLVARVDGLSFAYPDLPIVHDLSTVIMRGDKIGLIGPNGVGKTTLLRLLLGKIEPDEGNVKLGTNLQIAYFDQLREVLDDEASVIDNVGDGYSTVTINGRSKNIMGYVQDFLFAPDRARMQVKYLSGGERNRVLLAKLFAKPANVIVMDEPTNDLDAETLELLEERLGEYQGTVLVVSHDRSFLNNVVTSTIVFEEGKRGLVKEYVGGYDDWVRQRGADNTLSGDAGMSSSNKTHDAPPTRAATTEKRKLTYKEQQELGSLPKLIEELETEIQSLHEEMADPEFYKRPADELKSKGDRLKACEEQMAVVLGRWEELDRE